LACVEECPPFVIFSGAQPYVAKGKTNELDFVTFYAMTKQPLGPLDPCILQIMANLWFLLFSRGGAWPYAMAHIRTIWGQQHGLLWMNQNWVLLLDQHGHQVLLVTNVLSKANWPAFIVLFG